jgi:hypothetical protein
MIDAIGMGAIIEFLFITSFTVGINSTVETFIA